MDFLADLGAFLDGLIGLNTKPQALTLGQVAVRALLIYLAGFALLRFGEHRFLGKNTAFDVVLGFIFGSLLSRAINGDGPFWLTIVAGAILLSLHWVFATAAFNSKRLSKLLTGAPIPLIKDGEMQQEELRRARINERMLRENLRIHGHCTEPEHVRAAYYEPSGSVSVIPRADGSPHVVEVDVADGVQTVRIEMNGDTGVAD